MSIANDRASTSRARQPNRSRSELEDLRSQIEELQEKFQHIADLHPWITMLIPKRGRFLIGELFEPSTPLPGEAAHRRAVVQHVKRLTDRAPRGAPF